MRRNRLHLAGIVLASLTFLSGCFTTTLWHPDETELHHQDVAQRLVLTPFTLFLDFLTWPLQRALWEDDC